GVALQATASRKAPTTRPATAPSGPVIRMPSSGPWLASGATIMGPKKPIANATPPTANDQSTIRRSESSIGGSPRSIVIRGAGYRNLDRSANIDHDFRRLGGAILCGGTPPV